MKIDELTMPFNELPIDLHNLYNLIDCHPLTIDPDSYVIDAIRLMNQKGNTLPSTICKSSETYSKKSSQQTSYVLVVEAGNLLGIFTERDLVRLAASNFDLSDLKISEVMTQPVITMKMSNFPDIFTALSLLHQHQIRHLPILNDREQLIGIVSGTSLLQGLNQLETSYCLQSLQKPQQIEFLPYPSPNPLNELEHHDEFLRLKKVWQREIVEVRRAKQALRQSEARLNLALEAANMGIWDWYLLTNETIWSANMGLLYGLPNTTLCPSPEEFLQLVHPQDREKFSESVKNTIEQGIPFNIDYRTVWNDGSIHWLNSRGQVYHNGDGEPIRMIGTTRDISDVYDEMHLRQQAEQKIREQAALLEVATDAIFVEDLHKSILFWNQGAERLYGWLAQEAIGGNAQELLYSETSFHLHETALNLVMELGLWQGELQKLTKSGKEIIVESRWTLMRDAAGRPKSILIVDTDITQKKQLEEQFFRAQRLESLGTLAGGIAHDLNNILTPILAASQLLKVKFPNDRGRTVGGTSSQHLLEIVESNARRGAGLVKQVLSFARGFKGERTIVQLKHLITDIILIGKQTFPKSIEFTSNFPEELWAVCGDVTQLHQVLMNLVVNARDAMPNGGKISVTAENILIDETYASMILEAQVGNYIELTVTDTGTGMSPEILNRIFEPFFTTKEVGAGTGLGLSTVLGIIKSHGGFVKVSSKVGQGSQFKVFLPAIPATPDLRIEEIETPSGNGELILVVDDEAPICEIAKVILEKYNYKILTACNGIEAIALYAQHKHHISAVLMDMMMPEMDGATAIRTLKKMNSKVQVIASSGINSTETVAQALMIGVQQVLPKPFTAKELLNSLHHVLGG